MTTDPRNNLKQAQYGTHLVLPLKQKSPGSAAQREALLRRSPFYPDPARGSSLYRPKGSDLTELVNGLFDPSCDYRIATVYSLDRGALLKACFGESEGSFFLEDEKGAQAPFDVDRVFLYCFDTTVAFLCLSFRYSEAATMKRIFDPSLVRLEQPLPLFFSGKSRHRLPMKEFVRRLIEPAGYSFFYDVSDTKVFSDAYAASLAVLPERMSDLHQMKRAAFHLQRLLPPDSDEFNDGVVDASLFTFPNPSKGTYQWCSNVGDCSLSRIRCSADFTKQTEDFRSNTLTLLMLTLYQKYSGLLFSEQLRTAIRNKKSFSSLENAIIRFQAFGELSPSNVSRVGAVRELYRQLSLVNGVSDSLEEIRTKRKLIADHEKEEDEAKTNLFMILLSLFGILSIVADTVSIVEALANGNRIALITSLASTAVVLLLALLLLRKNRKR